MFANGSKLIAVESVQPRTVQPAPTWNAAVSDIPVGEPNGPETEAPAK